MKYLTVALIILIVGFGACKKSETVKEPQKQDRSSEQSEITNQIFPKTMYANAEAGVRRRSEPSLDSIRIGAYSHGEKIEVIERSSTPVTIDGITDYWYKTKANITFEGKLYEYSWVFGGYLSENKPEIKQAQGQQSQQTKRTVKYYYYHYDTHDDIETHYIFFDDGTAFDSRLATSVTDIPHKFKLDRELEYVYPNRTYKEFKTWLFFEAGAMSEQEENFYDDNGNILDQWKIFNYKKRN